MQAFDLRDGLDIAPTAIRRLTNGLTVIVREHDRAPVVAIVTHVRAGYLDETDDIVGISHVLEHMYFKGTARRGPGEIARETKAAGGYLNASTSYDHTRYYTVLPASALEQGMEIQADALSNSIIDADELARELRVIIEESKRKRDTPSAVAAESLYETLFDRHRMRRWRIGTEDQLAGYGRDHVIGFYERFYRPDAIVLAVAGDVEAEHVFELAERNYGALPPQPAPNGAVPTEPARTGFRYRELAGDLTRAHIDWGWRGEAAAAAETPALDLLGTVLGQGRASRLYREVREPGRALTVSASNFATRDIGVFGISAETRPGEARDTLAAIAESIGRLLADGIRVDEVERAQRLFAARLLRRLETAEGRAMFLAEWQALGDWRLGEAYLKAAAEVDADRLTQLARERITPDRATVLVYGPEGALEHASADAVANRLFGAPPPAFAGPPRAPAVIAPHGSAVFEREEDAVRFYRTDGARIVVQPRRGTGLASIVVAVAGGGVHESTAQAGLTSLMMRVSPKGTGSRSADEIAILSEELGGSLVVHADADFFEWRITVPAAAVVPALDVLADVAFRPSFPDDAVERERRMALDDVANVRDDMMRYPMSLMLGTAMPRHAYGFPLEALEASLAAVNRDAIVDWHRARAGAAEPWIVVVGDVDADAVANTAAGGLPQRTGSPAQPLPPPEWPHEPLESSAERDRRQTAIAIGLPGPDRNADDLFPLLLAGNAVGGLGGRAFEELRSRRSLAYVVNLRPLARRTAGAFMGYIATSPEREEEAREALLHEMVRIAEHGVEDDELDRARRYSLGAWDIRRQTTAALASDLVGALVLGTGLDELRRFPERIRAVTPDDVRRAATRWFDPDRAVIGVVRGRSD